MKRTVSVALFVALVLAAQGVMAATSIRVSGVARSEDGKGVAGVTVTASWRVSTPDSPFGDIGESRATTDAAGRFAVELAEGARNVTFNVEVPPKSRWHLLSYRVVPDILDIVVDRVEPAELTLVMKEGAGVFTGKVTDEAGKPVRDAAVVLTRKLNHPRTNNDVVRETLSVTTGADGTYRAADLVSGFYDVDSVTPPRGSGLVPLSGWRGVGGAQVIRAMPATRDFTLAPGGSIRGRVVDETGKPIAGAKVSAGLAPATIDGPTYFQKAGNFSDGTTTDKDGCYALVGLSNETYSVTASGPEGSSLSPSGALTGIRVEAMGTVPSSVQDLVLVPGGSLKGRITGADGKPVAGVTVVYGGKTVETGADGTYRFTALSTGVAKLTLLPPRGSVWAATTVEDVACVAKLSIVRDVALVEGGVVTGQVRGADGNAVPNVAVGAYCGNHHYATTSDKDGKFRLVGLVENKGVDYQKTPVVYSLVARPSADSPYMGGSVRFGIKPGQTLSEDLVLDPGASVRVKATTPDGKPVAGASVAVFTEVGRGGRSYCAGAGHGMGKSLVTGADGTLLIRQLPQGVKDLSVDPPDGVNLLYAEKRGVNLVAGETAEATVVLKPGGVIRGTLVDEKGKPVPEAEVKLSAKKAAAMGWGQSPKPATTGDDGRFEFAGLPAGGYQLEVQLHDGKLVAMSQSVDAVEGKETETKPVARVGGFIEVSVTGADGKPLPSFSAYATARTESGAFSASGYPQKSGKTVIGPLVPGNYDVSVTAYGGREKRYKKAEVKGVEVKPGQRTPVSVKVDEEGGARPEDLERKKKGEMEDGPPAKGGKPTGVLDGALDDVTEQVFER